MSQTGLGWELHGVHALVCECCSAEENHHAPVTHHTVDLVDCLPQGCSLEPGGQHALHDPIETVSLVEIIPTNDRGCRDSVSRYKNRTLCGCDEGGNYRLLEVIHRANQQYDAAPRSAQGVNWKSRRNLKKRIHVGSTCTNAVGNCSAKTHQRAGLNGQRAC